MKKRTGGLIIGGIVIAVLVYLIWPRDTTQDAVEVEVAPVTQQDFSDVVSTVGIIEPTETESFFGEGIVNEINVAEGDSVDEDDVLATYMDGVELIAPFSGEIISLNIEEEEMDLNAQQNQPSIVLAKLDDLQVAVALSKTEANKVETEQNVELTYLNKTYNGEVSSIDLIASSDETNGMSAMGQGAQSSPTLEAIIAFDEDEDLGELVAGFDIDADIQTESVTGALGIPIESLLYDDEGQAFVFLVADGQLEKREVSTGIQDGVMIEITDGLSLDDEVVQLPSEDFEEGMEVTVVSGDSDDSEDTNDSNDENSENNDSSNDSDE